MNLTPLSLERGEGEASTLQEPVGDITRCTCLLFLPATADTGLPYRRVRHWSIRRSLAGCRHDAASRWDGDQVPSASAAKAVLPCVIKLARAHESG
jgi:hypothetical protein